MLALFFISSSSAFSFPVRERAILILNTPYPTRSLFSGSPIFFFPHFFLATVMHASIPMPFLDLFPPFPTAPLFLARVSFHLLSAPGMLSLPTAGLFQARHSDFLCQLANFPTKPFLCCVLSLSAAGSTFSLFLCRRRISRDLIRPSPPSYLHYVEMLAMLFLAVTIHNRYVTSRPSSPPFLGVSAGLLHALF